MGAYNHLVYLIVLALAVSFWVYAWVYWLTNAGQALQFVQKLYNLKKKVAAERAYAQENGEPWEKKQAMADSIARWDFYAQPLFSCHRCVAGQAAFWVYPLIALVVKYQEHPRHYFYYSFLEHITLICLVIFLTEVYHKFFQVCEKYLNGSGRDTY